MFKEKDLERAVELCKKEHARYCLNHLCYLSIGPRYVPCQYFERFQSAKIGFDDNDNDIKANYCSYESVFVKK